MTAMDKLGFFVVAVVAIVLACLISALVMLAAS
jgi:hypothetical protein